MFERYPLVPTSRLKSLTNNRYNSYTQTMPVNTLAKGQAKEHPTVLTGPVYEDMTTAPKEEIELCSNQAYGPVPKGKIELKTNQAYGSIHKEEQN